MRALAAAPSRCGTTRVIAIDGRSGAGKSTLARAVGTRLGAPVLQLEGLYDGWDGLERGVARLASDVLAPLARGEAVEVPQWDWHAEAWGAPRRLPARLPALVVEGVGAAAMEAAPFASLVVWVEAPDAVRQERAIARDGDTYKPFWDTWARQEQALLERDDIRSRADLVIEL
jgi:para-aminobenzoate synthetase